MKLLLLSDLHFGYEETAVDEAKRKNIMKALFGVPEIAEVDVVMFTGDISWKCKESGYNSAETWIEELRKHIKPEAVLISCCGNHDIVRYEIAQLEYCETLERANETLCFEQLEMLSRRFKLYIDFCKKNRFCKLSLFDEENYLVGRAKIGNVNFWVFNSAWYALKAQAHDKGKLWLGTNFYHDMFSKPNTGLSICLMHHPKEWLANNELNSYDRANRSLYALIAKDCNVCFTGHTHSNPQEPSFEHNHMWTFSTGAIYTAEDHQNNFSIYDIDESSSQISRHIYYCNDSQSWERQSVKQYSLAAQHTEALANERLPESANTLKIDEKASMLFESFDSLNISANNLSTNDLLSPHEILWPVVPRKTLTNIHLAQLELMKILCLDFGWTIHAIISNCGKHSTDNTLVPVFHKNLLKYLETQGIRQSFSASMLGEYFSPTSNLASAVLESFIKISMSTRMPVLKAIKTKNYSGQDISEINDSLILDYILPVLQISVIKAIINSNEDRKHIVIAGHDEHEQWDVAVRNIGASVGTILIPELNLDDNNIRQDSSDSKTKRMNLCKSKKDLDENLHEGNLASWLYRLFIALPNYSDANIHSSFSTLPPKDLIQIVSDNSKLISSIDKNAFLNAVWKRIEPSIV